MKHRNISTVHLYIQEQETRNKRQEQEAMSERESKKRKSTRSKVSATIVSEDGCVFATCDECGVETEFVSGDSDKSVKQALAMLNKGCSCGADFHYAKDRPEADEDYKPEQDDDEEEEEGEVSPTDVCKPEISDTMGWWFFDLKEEDDTVSRILDSVHTLNRKMLDIAFQLKAERKSVDQWVDALTQGLRHLQAGEQEQTLRSLMMLRWLHVYEKEVIPFAKSISFSSDWKVLFFVAERGMPAALPESIPKSLDSWYEQAQKALQLAKNVYAINISFGDGPAGFGSCLVHAVTTKITLFAQSICELVNECKTYRESNISLVSRNAGAATMVLVHPPNF